MNRGQDGIYSDAGHIYGNCLWGYFIARIEKLIMGMLTECNCQKCQAFEERVLILIKKIGDVIEGKHLGIVESALCYLVADLLVNEEGVKNVLDHFIKFHKDKKEIIH